MNSLVDVIIGENETRYIRKERLEDKLHLLFGYPIRVKISHFGKLPFSLVTIVLGKEIADQWAMPSPQSELASICSKNSIRPLGITLPAIRKLMREYDIDDSFFYDLVVSFGYKPRNSDAGHGGMNVRQKENGAHDMYYLFAYPENGSSNGGPPSWTMRQVGVFHRHDPSGSSLWILLHVRPRSKLQERVEQTLLDNPAALLTDWFAMHRLVLSTYLHGWRWFIGNMGDEIERTVDIVLTLDLSKPRSKDHEDGLVHLLKQQYLEDRLIPVASRLGVALTTLRRLEKMNSLFHSQGMSSARASQIVVDDLAHHITSLEGHTNSVLVLEKKLRGISDLLTVALNVKNQGVTVENQDITIGLNNQMLGINNQMLDVNNKLVQLTNKSLDENATVQIVTIVTLIYLPASFISTVLGMNLFDYGAGGNLNISHQFWIFVVLTIPLTVLTVGSWYYLKRRRRLRKKRANDLKDQAKNA